MNYRSLSRSYIDDVAVPEDANFAAVITNAETHSLALFRFRVEHEDIRDIERHRLVLDTTGLTHVRVWLDVLFGNIDTLIVISMPRKVSISS